MAMSRRTGRSKFTLVLLVLTSITILTLNFRGASGLDSVRDGVATVFSPVRGAADRVFSPVGDAWNGVFSYDEVKKQNDELRAENDTLRGQAAAGQDATKQLEEIAAANQLAIVSQIPSVTARVSSGPISNFDHTITIDQGTDKGIKVGMPVVTGAGLAGRVIQATPNQSVVKVITDPDFLMGIRLTTSQQIGVAHGTGDGTPLRVESGIDPKAEVPVGEVVTTSGVDRSIFPPGIPVGTVTAVDVSPDQLSKILTVAPLADMSRLAFVKVVLWEPTQ